MALEPDVFARPRDIEFKREESGLIVVVIDGVIARRYNSDEWRLATATTAVPRPVDLIYHDMPDTSVDIGGTVWKIGFTFKDIRLLERMTGVPLSGWDGTVLANRTLEEQVAFVLSSLASRNAEWKWTGTEEWSSQLDRLSDLIHAGNWAPILFAATRAWYGSVGAPADRPAPVKPNGGPPNGPLAESTPGSSNSPSPSTTSD